MVIGNGLLASVFMNYKTSDSVLIFASGVSNSQEKSVNEFLREEKLLLKNLSRYYDKKIVYFSTCSMYDKYSKQNEYTKHKLKMEKLIKENSKNYNIFRLPQVLGNNNKKQLIGFLFDAINSEKEFDLYNIERNIIDIIDVFKIVESLIVKEEYSNKIINIANPKNIKVLELVKVIESICNKDAKYKILEKEGSFIINKDIVRDDLFEKNYIKNRIVKYYGK